MSCIIDDAMDDLLELKAMLKYSMKMTEEIEYLLTKQKELHHKMFVSMEQIGVNTSTWEKISCEVLSNTRDMFSANNKNKAAEEAWLYLTNNAISAISSRRHFPSPFALIEWLDE